MKVSTKLLLAGVVIFLMALTGIGGFFLGKSMNSSKKDETDNTQTESDKSETDKDITKSSQSNPNGPYYHQVFSATSTDGIIWEKQGIMLFDHASVPGAVLKDDKIYLYFVDASGEEDQLSVGISNDLGKTFTKDKVVIQGMPSYDSVDPHPELVNGKIMLYFLGDFMSGHVGGMSEKFTMYSAVSTNGVNFTELNQAYQTGEITTDPDVFQTSSDWRMFVSHEKGMDLLISHDNGNSFAKDENFTWTKGGVSDTIKIGSQYYTYFCGTGIQSATGADQGQLTQEPGSRIDAKDEMGKILCDPSVIQLPDGSYLMFYKTQKPQEKN
jgi:hypothetical protein